METQQVSTWNQLIDVIKDIQRQYSTTMIDEFQQRNLVLYRGLADSNWQLDTTLERQSSKLWTLKSYYWQIWRCAPQIESFSESSWNLGSPADVEKDLETCFRDYTVEVPHYEYWAYLRHHGFPSPLLDWSKSPYIALFFALYEQSKADSASIYAYIEMPSGTKGGIGGAPMISVQQPNIKTHKRHFLQQSCYTVATELDQEVKKNHRFVAHEQVFRMNYPDQDVLIKIIFPRNIRREALEILNSYNINQFSLMQTEDALVQTLALEQLEL